MFVWQSYIIKNKRLEAAHTKVVFNNGPENYQTIMGGLTQDKGGINTVVWMRVTFLANNLDQ